MNLCITGPSYSVADGREEVGVAVEIETLCRCAEFLLVVVFLVVEHITLNLQIIVVQLTKSVDHVQHVQSCTRPSYKSTGFIRTQVYAS